MGRQSWFAVRAPRPWLSVSVAMILAGVAVLLAMVGSAWPAATPTDQQAAQGTGASPRAAATDQLPDLGMAKLGTFVIDTTTMPGHTLLRYTARLVNVGAGPLVLVGSRPDTSTPNMGVVQRIYDASGSYTELPVSTYMFYAGDGHNHWHTADVEDGDLERLDNGQQVGVLAKHGFCFSDNTQYRLTLPGAPSAPVYRNTGCSPRNPDALTTLMGLSVGWGDTYKYSTNLQWVDITGLPDGQYRLTATADPTNALVESSYTNNGVWANLLITGSSIKVLKKSPGA